MLQCGEQRVQLWGVYVLRAPSSEPCGLSYGVGMKGVNFILSLSLYFSYVPGFIFQTGVGASFSWLLSFKEGLKSLGSLWCPNSWSHWTSDSERTVFLCPHVISRGQCRRDGLFGKLPGILCRRSLLGSPTAALFGHSWVTQ